MPIAGAWLRHFLHSEFKPEFLMPPIDKLVENAPARAADFLLRPLLAEILTEQYASLQEAQEEISLEVRESLRKLTLPDSVTVTTGHQLHPIGGPLFFTYKILSTVRLSKSLIEKGVNAVPVFWLASEDHDMEEIQEFHAGPLTVKWSTDHHGPSGDALCRGLDAVWAELSAGLSGQPFLEDLIALFESIYTDQRNLSLATRIWVNRCFGHLGVVVLDARDARLKSEFVPAMKRELQTQMTQQAVNALVLESTSWGEPAIHPRNINLFYINANGRYRIEKEETDDYKLVGTDQAWDLNGILNELDRHPERFSPNVLMRPLYQETILPNIAYIGGMAEINYWLQLSRLFDSMGVKFPALYLRNAFLVTEEKDYSRLQEYGIHPRDFLLPEVEWVKIAMLHLGSDRSPLDESASRLAQVFDELKVAFSSVDSTLIASVESEKAKTLKGLEHLSEKWNRAEKRKQETVLNQLHKIHLKWHPGGKLQERSQTILPWLVKYRFGIMDQLLAVCQPIPEGMQILRLGKD